MTATMERPTISSETRESPDLASLYREGLAWRALVNETLLEIIHAAAADGGAIYHDVLNEVQTRLASCYSDHNHDRDFFNSMLNQLSISRQIDSGRGNRLYVAGEQPWLQQNALARAAIERLDD